MLAAIATIPLLLAAQSAQGSADCDQGKDCVQADATQLFALADQLYSQGDFVGAASILEALTQDKHPELRAEARFRLSAVREKMGDLKGAAQALRDLLAEQPGANRARLELARILSRMGDARSANAELALAEAAGLPPEVEQNVRRFASSLHTTKRRGGSIEVSAGPDSNVNRSTSSAFIDTIIAPFELDPDARRQAALGYTGTIRGYSRDPIGPVTLLSNAGLRADLSTKPRFNDIQLALDSGPEFALGKARFRPAALYERRWYGGDPFASGIGAQAELLAPLGKTTQIDVLGSRVHQRVAKNSGQDGWRTAVSADITRSLKEGTTIRATLRYGSLDARVESESLRQLGTGLLVAHEWRPVTLFGEVDYTRTHGIEPLFLFGKTRHDARLDFTGGAIFSRANLGGFSPLVRLIYTRSNANIALWNYQRTRLDIGFTRSF